MDGPGDTDVLPIYDEEQPDLEYARITAQGLKEAEARPQAEAQRAQAQASPSEMRTPEEKAEHLRKFADSAFLHAAMRSADGPIFDIHTFKAYLDDLLQRAGAPGDPLEAMLIQQLAHAHFAIGRLHVRASGSRNTDEATACLVAAARFMAESRKTTLAVQTYREKAARKQAEAERSAAPRRRKKRPAPAGNAKRARKKQMTANTEMGSNHAPVNRVNGYLHEPEPALC